jgi:hypothetical protein
MYQEEIKNLKTYLNDLSKENETLKRVLDERIIQNGGK